MSCERCQQSNITIKARPAAELHPIPVISDLWKQWGIDYIGPFQETKRGNKYIIAATDYFSKFPEAMAVPKNDAQTTARFLLGCTVDMDQHQSSYLTEDPTFVIRYRKSNLHINYIILMFFIFVSVNPPDKAYCFENYYMECFEV